MTDSIDNSNKEQDDMDNTRDNPPTEATNLPDESDSQKAADYINNPIDDDNRVSLDKPADTTTPAYVESYYEEDDQSDENFEGDDFGDDSYHTPVPGIDNDFYETNQGFDDDDTYLLDGDQIITPKDNSDEAALLLANIYGVGGVLRENAVLTQNVKNLRKNFFLSCLVSICLAVVAFVLVVAFLSYPKTRYIPTYDNKAICEVSPENNPNITDVSISDFAKDAVLNLYTFDYVNHEAQINDTLERWFTPRGRIDTINAMAAIDILTYVKKNALTLQAGTTSAAKIEQKGRTPEGEPYWIVRFPLVIDIYSGAPRPEDTQNYLVTVRVVASSASAQNPKGLGVVSATLAPSD